MSSYVSDTGFCGDRTERIYGRTTYFGSNDRSNYSNTPDKNKPILTCPQVSDNYTVEDTTKGNGQLSYPVALLNQDEVAMAGGLAGTTNTNYYLYNNFYNWLLSPSTWSDNIAFVFNSDSAGDILQVFVGSTSPSARPSLHLLGSKALIAEGDGTVTNPYVIKTN